MKPTKLSNLEIAARVKGGKTFDVKTAPDRKRVLDAAKYLGVEVTTSKNDNGGFTVKFVQP